MFTFLSMQMQTYEETENEVLEVFVSLLNFIWDKEDKQHVNKNWIIRKTK